MQIGPASFTAGRGGKRDEVVYVAQEAERIGCASVCVPYYNSLTILVVSFEYVAGLLSFFVVFVVECGYC